MKVYSGKRELVNARGEPDDLGDTVVRVNGKPLPLRLELANHSPTGFEWGYRGSGPAQLALAIAADLVGDERALDVYQAVKDQLIARIDSPTWTLTGPVVLEVIEREEAQQQRGGAA